MSAEPEENELIEDSSQLAHQLKPDFLNKKFLEILQKHPLLSADQAFLFEYCKLYIETLSIQNQIGQSIKQIDRLKAVTNFQCFKLRKNTNQLENHDTSNEERRKRVRRTANEIARHYVCRVEKCQKSYGSEGSLNQHMKIKHPELLDGNF